MYRLYSSSNHAPTVEKKTTRITTATDHEEKKKEAVRLLPIATPIRNKKQSHHHHHHHNTNRKKMMEEEEQRDLQIMMNDININNSKKILNLRKMLLKRDSYSTITTVGLDEMPGSSRSIFLEVSNDSAGLPTEISIIKNNNHSRNNSSATAALVEGSSNGSGGEIHFVPPATNKETHQEEEIVISPSSNRKITEKQEKNELFIVTDEFLFGANPDASKESHGDHDDLLYGTLKSNKPCITEEFLFGSHKNTNNDYTDRKRKSKFAKHRQLLGACHASLPNLSFDYNEGNLILTNDDHLPQVTEEFLFSASNRSSGSNNTRRSSYRSVTSSTSNNNNNNNISYSTAAFHESLPNRLFNYNHQHHRHRNSNLTDDIIHNEFSFQEEDEDDDGEGSENTEQEPEEILFVADEFLFDPPPTAAAATATNNNNGNHINEKRIRPQLERLPSKGESDFSLKAPTRTTNNIRNREEIKWV